MAWLIESYLNEGIFSGLANKKEQKEREKQIEFAKILFQDLQNWYNDPTKYLPFGHTGNGSGYYFIILKMMKVPENKIINYICKKCKNKAQTLDNWFKTQYYGNENYWKEDIEPSNDASSSMKNTIKQYVNDQVIEFTNDDEESTFVDINKKSLIYYCCENIKTVSLYKWLSDREWGAIMYNNNELLGTVKFTDIKTIETAIKEADKELGYYLFSDCPEGVKQKEWPIKL